MSVSGDPRIPRSQVHEVAFQRIQKSSGIDFTPNEFTSAGEMKKTGTQASASYGQAYGTGSEQQGMSTAGDPNAAGRGQGSFTPWSKMMGK